MTCREEQTGSVNRNSSVGWTPHHHHHAWFSFFLGLEGEQADTVQGADIYIISSLSLDKDSRPGAPLTNSSTVHPINTTETATALG